MTSAADLARSSPTCGREIPLVTLPPELLKWYKSEVSVARPHIPVRWLEVATAKAHLEHAEGLAKSADKWADPEWLATVQKAAAERRVSLSGKDGEELPVDVLRGLLRLTIDRVTVTPGKGGDATFDIGIAFRDIFGPDADLTTGGSGERVG